MRSYILTGFLFIISYANSQVIPVISESEVIRVERTLAADDMQGRKVYTAGIEKAADFIANEFKAAGLKPITGSPDFKQHFSIIDPEITEAMANLDGSVIDKKNIVAFTADSFLTVTQDKKYRKVYLKQGSNFSEVLFKYLDGNENVLILVDTTFASKFARLANS
ncbi:MAG: hypothetical protein M3N30_04360, partial [Bacteroidota bacterium]|nr:hypothetical protein [Bacteroidota bacterium]